MKTLLTICLAAAVAIGCGGKKDEGKAKGGDNAPAAKAGGGDKAAPPAGDGPTIDCAAFNTKMNECLEPFAAAYAKTEMGGKSGKKEIGGPVDEELAAKNFKTLWSMAGEQLCAGGDAVMDTPYSKRDKRWKERFVACDNAAACDVWVPCMANAVGELLPAQ